MEERVLEIDDLGVLEILNSPVRHKILRHLETAKSVKELAEAMEVPPTRLYYHVNLLAENGVIECVETRKAGAALERIYQSKASMLRPSRRLLEGGHDPAEVARVGASVLLDGARADVEGALRRHFGDFLAPGEQPGVKLAVARTLVGLDEEGVEVVRRKLDDLLETIGELDREDGDEYAMTLVFVPVLDEAP